MAKSTGDVRYCGFDTRQELLKGFEILNSNEKAEGVSWQKEYQ